MINPLPELPSAEQLKAGGEEYHRAWCIYWQKLAQHEHEKLEEALKLLEQARTCEDHEDEVLFEYAYKDFKQSIEKARS